MVTGMDMDMARKRTPSSPRKSLGKKFSSLSWQRRSLYAVVIVLAALVGIRAAALPLSSVANRMNPALADQVNENHRSALTLLMIEGLKDPKVLEKQEIVDVARARLIENPLDAPAMRMLAFHYSVVGEKRKSAKLARMAVAISQRDELAQLLLAQDAAESGDGAAAMRYFDTALRTTDRGREQIFDVLSKLGDNPEVFDALLLVANDRSAWMGDYLLYSARNSPSGPKNAARLLLAGNPQDKSGIIKNIGTDLLTLLSVRGEFDLMRPLYRLMRGKQPDITANPRLTSATIAPQAGPFAWTAANDVSVGGAIGKEKGGRTVASAYASRNTGGVAIRRTLALPPGAYKLTEVRRTPVESDGARAYWTMKCPALAGAPVIWTSSQDQLAVNAKGVPGPTIGANCGVQELELNLTGGSSISGAEIVIDTFDLVR